MTAVVKSSNNLPDSNSPAVIQSNAGKSAKAMVASNKSDGSRKQGGGANESAQRKAPAPKAWSGGVNPITQRSNTPTTQNGSISHGKFNLPMGGSDKAQIEEGPNPKLVLLVANAAGCNSTVTLINGDVYEGILYQANLDKPEPEFQFKMVQLKRRGDKGDSKGTRETKVDDYVGADEDHTMTFKTKEVIDITFDDLATGSNDRRLNGNTGAAFRTDTDISGRKGGQQRQLQAWVPPEDMAVDQALESSTGAGTWDQFEANKNLFGVQSDYDESFYTTRIDTSHPNYRQRAADAARIAQTMGENLTDDAIDDQGADEEDKYSGVKREATDYPPLQSTQPNRYQPPARRAPTSKPTVSGAPVDPAIIASSMARPGTSPKLEKGQKIDKHSNVASTPSAVQVPGKQIGSSENGKIDKGASRLEAADMTQAQDPSSAATTNEQLKVVFGAFKQFGDKQRYQVADNKRLRDKQDKSSKLNELTAFSKSFKLRSLVPSDLVPILAKDPKKQEAIVEKAQKEVDDTDNTTPKFVPRPIDQVTPKQPFDPKREQMKAGHTLMDRSDVARYNGAPRGPHSTLPLRDRQAQHSHGSGSTSNEHGGLSQRLAKTQRDRQAGIASQVPTPLPISTQKPPSRPNANVPRMASQGSNSLRTPTSATSGKFNVKAHEFVPNPTASSFMPTARPSSSSSPRAPPKGRPVTPASSQSELFGKKMPIPSNERPSISDHFNPLKRLKEKAEKDGKLKDSAANGGIPFAHATPPTWPSADPGRTYQEIFDGTAHSHVPSPRPMTSSPINPNLIHQHQLPHHLQHPHGTPPMQTPHQGPFPSHQHGFYPGMPQHFDEQRAPSSQGHYGVSRTGHPYGPYPIPAGQSLPGPVPGTYPYPNMNGGHHQMVSSSGGPPPHLRQFPPGNQYMPVPGQPLAAPMMVQQGSQGPFFSQGGPMGPIPVYATGASPYGPSQPSSGYPSPGRGAPLMVHQGSYQGQNAQMGGAGAHYNQQFYLPQPPPHNMAQMRAYASPQPQFSQSPQQQHYYPAQPHRAASHGYSGQSTQMPHQHPPHPNGPSEGGEGMK